MPLFEFSCETCNLIIERYTPSYDLQSIKCHKCNGDATKINKVYAPVLDFQGSGFHKTDYK